jgi:hypothetical protein
MAWTPAARFAAWQRITLRPTVSEADAALAVLKQHRGSRELARFTAALESAAYHQRRRVIRAIRP